MVSSETAKVAIDAVNAASGVAATAGKVTEKAGDILATYLIKALDKTGNAVEKSVDMVMEQAPLLVHEMLNWYFTYNLIQFVAGIVLFGLTIYVAPKITKRHWKTSEGFIIVPVACASIIAFVMCSALVNLQWLKIWIAPRLWMIEYTAELIKTAAR